jgi:hypothetical protein
MRTHLATDDDNDLRFGDIGSDDGNNNDSDGIDIQPLAVGIIITAILLTQQPFSSIEMTVTSVLLVGGGTIAAFR